MIWNRYWNCSVCASNWQVFNLSYMMHEFIFYFKKCWKLLRYNKNIQVWGSWVVPYFAEFFQNLFFKKYHFNRTLFSKHHKGRHYTYVYLLSIILFVLSSFIKAVWCDIILKVLNKLFVLYSSNGNK